MSTAPAQLMLDPHSMADLETIKSKPIGEDLNAFCLSNTHTDIPDRVLANTSEYRKYFDGALKDELDSSLYVDVPGFFDAFFIEITGLQSLAEVAFKKCQEGKDPLYKAEGGWGSWPKEVPEKEILKWFKDVIDKFLRFTEENGSTSKVG
ncbi:MAG: hypothetical protein M1840_005734 [Geoglossum simile]|nr:MAG: hypothetical protein M1840_005734 [Geoglossum simile]